ncbi:MAG TPA: zincin-like metallopeptidase domain-containing protein [Magnetospirillum sp.]|nr:zincin-like metallopeptidase domain-containing protein [Magnetospirillum sp.]
MLEAERDIHQRVTDQIVAAIEAGAGEYRMPWNPRLCRGASVTIPHNPVGRYGYRGINVLMLWASQQAGGFGTAEWATYRQWASAGAQVRKGEAGTLTVFYKPFEGKAHGEDDAEGEARPQVRLFARAGFVFNAAQVDGYELRPTPPLPDIQRHAAAEALVKASGALIHHGGPRACYIPSRDEIHLPPPGAFRNPEAYYGTTFHELLHWTGHESRCARDLRNRFGSEAYAAEELVAELGAAFLCAELGIEPEPRPDHACYIESWLKVLENDSRAIFTAAAKASQAASILTGLAAPATVAA